MLHFTLAIQQQPLSPHLLLLPLACLGCQVVFATTMLGQKGSQLGCGILRILAMCFAACILVLAPLAITNGSDPAPVQSAVILVGLSLPLVSIATYLCTCNSAEGAG